MKNRRIGLSQSGIIDAFTRHGRRNMLSWCEKGYDYIQKLDEEYSNWLCVPRSKRTTSTKPSGTVSLLPGVSPGIHYPHSQYYIRRVNIATNSKLANALRKAGYSWEFNAYGIDEKERERTTVFEFPVKEKYFDRRKQDVSIWEQIWNALDYQHYWADNSVSITVTFKEEEIPEIGRVLEACEDSLKNVSFLPLANNGGYKQAPYEEISEERYLEMASRIGEPDFSEIVSRSEGEDFCTNDACMIKHTVEYIVDGVVKYEE